MSDEIEAGAVEQLALDDVAELEAVRVGDEAWRNERVDDAGMPKKDEHWPGVDQLVSVTTKRSENSRVSAFKLDCE